MTPVLTIVGLLVIATVVAAVIGFVIGITSALYGAIAALVTRPRSISPRVYREQMRREGRLESDPGWPAYVHRQLFADLKEVHAQSWGAYAVLWEVARARYFATGALRRGLWILLFPLPAVTVASLIFAWPVLVAQSIVFALAFILVWVPASLAYWIVVALVRIGDGGWRAVLGGQASCPECYAVMSLPAYRHSDCTRRHRDVRPASEGATYRRCGCGTLIPITVTRAAWALTGHCNRCDAVLPRGSAALRDVRVSLVGDTNAGKSRLKVAAVRGLDTWARETGTTFRFASEQSAQAIDEAERTIRTTGTTTKTSASLPKGVSCQVGGAVGGSMLHLFDTAGERFHDGSTHDELRYLGDSHGLVFLVDPFSIDEVRTRLRADAYASLLADHPAQARPEDVYGAVVSRIRAAGARQPGQRLAVVLTKADLLTNAGMQVPTTSGEVSEWLHGRGQHNMVVAAQREFSEVKYFAVASTSGEKQPSPFDPSAPVRWILDPRRYERSIRTREVPA